MLAFTDASAVLCSRRQSICADISSMHVSSGDTGVTWLVNGVVGAVGSEAHFNGEALSMCKLAFAFAFVWACFMVVCIM